MGGTGIDAGRAIAVDAIGNVYVTGYFQATADFDPGATVYNLTSAGSWDAFVVKLDAAGNFQWAKQFGSGMDDEALSIALDGSGGVYTTGFFSDVADFDPGVGVYAFHPTGYDVFVSKLDTAGNFVWASQLGGASTEYAFSLAVDTFGNVFTIGDFQGTTDFDPSTATYNLNSAGGWDIFISKLSSSGNFLWAKQFGGTNSDEGYSIGVDATGNCYSTGYFKGVADFDPGINNYYLTAAGTGADIFVSKLDSAGKFKWAKNYGDVNFDEGNAIAVDALGNNFTTGIFQGTADFNPGPDTLYLSSAGGSEDIFISKLDSAGNLVWAGEIGEAIDDDGGWAIALDPSGNIYASGLFNDTVDFNPGIDTFYVNSTGDKDAYVLKLSRCTLSSSTWSVTSCDSFISPSTHLIWSTSGTYFDTIPNASGCDSLLTINLTIKHSSSSTSTQFSSGIYNFNGTLLSSSGIYYDTLSNAAGCDSLITLNLTRVDGIEPLSVADAFSIYPNPNQGHFVIKSNFYCYLTITNVLGQSVKSMELNAASKYQVEIFDLPEGVYFVSGIYSTSMNRQKIVVTK